MFWLTKNKQTRKRLKKKPMRRSVYLMERKTNRTWKTILLGKREIKIGIAKDSGRRHQSVDAGIPGKVVIISEHVIDKASTVEAYLHKKYSNKNFTVKGAKKGSGSTEFFRLSSYEVRQIQKYLNRKSGNKNDLPIFYLIIISIIIIYLIKYGR